MKSRLRILSLLSFIIAIPSLIIIDWYFKGYGILIMFIFATIGLILDQIVGLKFMNFVVDKDGNYRKNKILNIFSLILLVQSPMGLIYGNRFLDNLGTFIMLIMICLGISLNQIAKKKYSYTIRK